MGTLKTAQILEVPELFAAEQRVIKVEHAKYIRDSRSLAQLFEYLSRGSTMSPSGKDKCL